MKPLAQFSSFEALDLRVGRILKVEEAATRKPTYRIIADFGPEIGTKVTCGAFRRYSADELLGKLIVGVVNLGSKKMGPEVSEFLMLGVPTQDGETIYLSPENKVELGVAVF
jgi:tRNA-binding protein